MQLQIVHYLGIYPIGKYALNVSQIYLAGAHNLSIWKFYYGNSYLLKGPPGGQIESTIKRSAIVTELSTLNTTNF